MVDVVPTGSQLGRSGHLLQSPWAPQEARTEKNSTNTNIFMNKRVGDTAIRQANRIQSHPRYVDLT
jgi:beta-galactosidase beta subunit